MHAKQKSPMHQHVINSLKSKCIPEKSNLIKILEKIVSHLFTQMKSFFQFCALCQPILSSIENV